MIGEDLLNNCRLCPRLCGVNRHTEVGYCKCSDKPLVSSIFLHKGEEPVISGNSGICNVFFAHCNLQCVFCQNYQISTNSFVQLVWERSIEDVASEIILHLDKGVSRVGFVSPSHQVFQMVQIIDSLHAKGYHPTIVYNTNAYDNVEVLKQLEDVVDVYLPDFKYFSNDLGSKYSKVSNYFDIASKAIKEMYRQKGSYLLYDNDDLATSGLIVRHLVLPGHADDSVNLLRYLADEISPRLHVSLMSQFYPPDELCSVNPIKATLTQVEYDKVLLVMEEIGFRGWAQLLESANTYQPDFSDSKPFNDSSSY